MSGKKVLQAGISRERFPIGEERHTELGVISDSAKKHFPFFLLMPYRDPVAMLRLKYYVRHRCVRDLEFRNAIWEICRRDVMACAALFLWIHEPRPPRSLPFCPWIDQVNVAAWIMDTLGERDLGLSKSRGIGVSWLMSVICYHQWRFVKEIKIGLLTKDVSSLESSDSNSTLGKILYLHSNMPVWSQFTDAGLPVLHHVAKHNALYNTATQGTIQGFASTNEKLRQLRFTFIWADEFAFFTRDSQKWMVSSRGTTNCRICTSSWNSFNDYFHHIMYGEPSSMLRVFMFWWANEERWKGAYKMVNGSPEILDKSYPFPTDYPWGQPDVLPEGTIRSPWIDAELSAPGQGGPDSIREFYGPMFAKTDSSFFQIDFQNIVQASLSEPTTEGQADFDTEEIKVYPTNKSNLRLWENVPTEDRGPYVIGCDIGNGSRDAYSVATAIDKYGKQVMEYGVNTVVPTEFCQQVVRLARWLNGRNGDGWTMIDFDSAGPTGGSFAKEIRRLDYGNVARTKYVRKNNKHGTFKNSDEDHIGSAFKDKGFKIYRELERAAMVAEVSIKSKMIQQELPLFGYDDNGFPTFPKYHRYGNGDFIYAFALAWNRARESVMSLREGADDSDFRDFDNWRDAIMEENSGDKLFSLSDREFWFDNWR